MVNRFPLNNLQKLLPFVEVVKSGSFVGAAAALKVTPPAISRSIARLEEDLGVRLFSRTTRSVHLTTEGRAFHARVGELLNGLDEAVTVLRQTTDEPKGLIKVSVTATFGRYALLPVISRFTARYPEVELLLSFDEVPPGLVEAGLDVRIQQGSGKEGSQVSRQLCLYPIVLVASPEYLARKGVPRTPDDLVHHDCISVQMPQASSWDLARVDGRSGRYVHTPRGPVSVAGQRDGSLIAALYGTGIAPTAELVAQSYVTSGRLRIVLPDYRLRTPNAKNAPSRIHVQVPHKKHMPAKVRVFLDFLYECFSDAPSRRAGSKKSYSYEFIAKESA